jgi:hypothetical protein
VKAAGVLADIVSALQHSLEHTLELKAWGVRWLGCTRAARNSALEIELRGVLDRLRMPRKPMQGALSLKRLDQ